MGNEKKDCVDNCRRSTTNHISVIALNIHLDVEGVACLPINWIINLILVNMKSVIIRGPFYLTKTRDDYQTLKDCILEIITLHLFLKLDGRISQG